MIDIPETCPYCGEDLHIVQVAEVWQAWAVNIIDDDHAEFGDTPETIDSTEETIQYECCRCHHALSAELVVEIERRLNGGKEDS